METRTPLIEFKNVTKRFGRLLVLDAIDLKIYDGEVTVIIGLSGTGKSVLLKHIVGLMEPDVGEILYNGKSLKNMNAAEKKAYLNDVSYMFQNNALFDSMTVAENVSLPLRYDMGLGKKEAHDRVLTYLRQTDLEGFENAYPAQLSGGMQKRVALARALATGPKVVLFDEPTTGQDPVRKNAILNMVAQYQRRFNFTAVLISHDIPDVFFISDRILVLYDRKIAFQGSPEDFSMARLPFKDELLQSLKEFEDNVNGLYAMQQFRLRYQSELQPSANDYHYVLAVLGLADFNNICNNLSKDMCRRLLARFEVFLEKYFGAKIPGSFFARLKLNEFSIMLPNMDEANARQILSEFAVEIGKDEEIITLLRTNGTQKQTAAKIDIVAGFAVGDASAYIENVFAEALKNQVILATLK